MLFRNLFQNLSVGMDKRNVQVIDPYNIALYEDARGLCARYNNITLRSLARFHIIFDLA